jgi:hypothetical protein
MASVMHQIALLKRTATAFHSFREFKDLCEEHLKATWQSDRGLNRCTTQIVKRSWQRLFRYVALNLMLVGRLTIRAANRSGAYICALIPAPDLEAEWQRLVRLGRLFGIHERQLARLRRMQVDATGSRSLAQSVIAICEKSRPKPGAAFWNVSRESQP